MAIRKYSLVQYSAPQDQDKIMIFLKIAILKFLKYMLKVFLDHSIYSDYNTVCVLLYYTTNFHYDCPRKSLANNQENRSIIKATDELTVNSHSTR